MTRIPIGDLLLVLNDLLSNEKKALLQASSVGRMYEKRLRKLLADIEALPEGLRGRPLADLLEEWDDRHDGFGRAIFYFVEAILHLPTATEAVREAALRVRAAFVPQLADLQAAYPTEASEAKRKSAYLGSHKADLDQLTVLGGSVGDWARGFIEAGDQLDALLSERGQATAAASLEERRKVGPLLQSGIGLLGRFREALRDEVLAEGNLPPDIEARLFAYYDELVRHRAADRRRSRPVDDPEPTTDPK